MSERFEVEVVDSDDPRWAGQKVVVVDRVDADIICECIESDDARKIAAALNAAEQAGRERELLNRAEEFASFMQFVVRGEPALAHSAATRAKCNRAEKWLAEYAALQTEGHDAKKQSS